LFVYGIEYRGKRLIAEEQVGPGKKRPGNGISLGQKTKNDDVAMQRLSVPDTSFQIEGTI